MAGPARIRRTFGGGYLKPQALSPALSGAAEARLGLAEGSGLGGEVGGLYGVALGGAFFGEDAHETAPAEGFGVDLAFDFEDVDWKT